MSVIEAIRRAEAILPGTPAPEGESDPRWQAIIAVAEFIPVDPEPIWSFVEKWGQHPNEDLRTAVATCLLEHLLESHFVLLFPRIEKLARKSPRFGETVAMCWKFGQAARPGNQAKFDRLLEDLNHAS